MLIRRVEPLDALRRGRNLPHPLQRGAGNPPSGVGGGAAGFYSGSMADEPAPHEAPAVTRPANEYDIPWKEAIEGAFPESMAFYFRAAHDAIDWTKGHEFLGWRPSQYRIDVLGYTHVFNFPTAKLLDFEGGSSADAASGLAALKRQSNPFALVTAAHLSALRTRRNVGRRFATKRELVRLLYEQGWERQRVIDLFAIIDSMLALPKELEHKVWKDCDEIERKTQMKYVTSVERLAIERGVDAANLAEVFGGH